MGRRNAPTATDKIARNARERARRRLIREREHRASGDERTNHLVQSSSVRIPAEVVAERDARAELSPRDLTASLLGDPLPGYSALERP